MQHFIFNKVISLSLINPSLGHYRHAVMESTGNQVGLVSQLVEIPYHSLSYQFLPFTIAGLVHDNADSFFQQSLLPPDFYSGQLRMKLHVFLI